jgi:hypothetical protein
VVATRDERKPGATMPTATATTTDRPTTAKLIVPRGDAVKHLTTLLNRGGEIKGLRIRNGDELDEARGHKLEWTQDSIDLLNQLFDSSSVADFCNDWVGKIFPEYAEFGNFVEQFYEEMDYRLGKLRTVLKRVEQAAETVSPLSAQPAENAEPPATDEGSEPSAAPRTQEFEESVMPAATPASHTKVLFVSHGPRDATVEAVLQFLQMLSLPVVEADHTNGLIETLESRNDTGFMLVMNGVDASPSGGLSENSIFKLGFCAGRLGIKRLCLLHASGHNIGGDAHGLPHVPVDTNGGWQLHLARQM